MNPRLPKIMIIYNKKIIENSVIAAGSVFKSCSISFWFLMYSICEYKARDVFSSSTTHTVNDIGLTSKH